MPSLLILLFCASCQSRPATSGDHAADEQCRLKKYHVELRIVEIIANSNVWVNDHTGDDVVQPGGSPAPAGEAWVFLGHVCTIRISVKNCAEHVCELDRGALWATAIGRGQRFVAEDGEEWVLRELAYGPWVDGQMLLQQGKQQEDVITLPMALVPLARSVVLSSPMWSQADNHPTVLQYSICSSLEGKEGRFRGSDEPVVVRGKGKCAVR